MVKELSYTRHAEADLAASRETIEELLIVNSRHAERARLAAAAQPSSSPVRGGAAAAANMRWPRGKSSAVEYSRYRTSSSSAAVAAATASHTGAGNARPVSWRTQVSTRTAALSSDDSDDEVAFMRYRGAVDDDTVD